QTFNETAANRIANHCKNDGNGACLSRHHRSRGSTACKNEVRLKRDEFLRTTFYELDIGRSPANVNVDVAAVHPSELSEFLPERRDPRLGIMVALEIGQQNTDSPHSIRLLRARRKRPRCCCATYQ